MIAYSIFFRSYFGFVGSVDDGAEVGSGVDSVGGSVGSEGIGVFVGSGIFVGFGVAVGFGVGVFVGTGAGDGVGDGVGVSVGIGVGVSVGTGVGVYVGAIVGDVGVSVGFSSEELNSATVVSKVKESELSLEELLQETRNIELLKNKETNNKNANCRYFLITSTPLVRKDIFNNIIFLRCKIGYSEFMGALIHTQNLLPDSGRLLFV